MIPASMVSHREEMEQTHVQSTRRTSSTGQENNDHIISPFAAVSAFLSLPHSLLGIFWLNLWPYMSAEGEGPGVLLSARDDECNGNDTFKTCLSLAAGFVYFQHQGCARLYVKTGVPYP